MSARERVLKEVRAALEHEPRINLRKCPVTMEFAGGVLTLEGEAEHIAAKKLSLELAKAVRIVLKKDPFVTGERIRVGARQSVVTLEGDAPSVPHKEMAECDAWYVFGVDKVINRLEVRP